MQPIVFEHMFTVFKVFNQLLGEKNMPKSSPIEMDGRARMCQLNDSLEEAAKFLKCALTINLSPN